MPQHFADLDAAEVIGLAIDVERNNAARFSIVSELFADDDPDISAIFRELSDEELAHIVILRRTAETLFPDGIPSVSVDDVVEAPERVDLNIRRITRGELTRADALRMAIQAEQDAHELYLRALGSTTDQALRQVYEILARLESEHRHVLVDWLTKAESTATR